MTPEPAVVSEAIAKRKAYREAGTKPYSAVSFEEQAQQRANSLGAMALQGLNQPVVLSAQIERVEFDPATEQVCTWFCTEQIRITVYPVPYVVEVRPGSYLMRRANLAIVTAILSSPEAHKLVPIQKEPLPVAEREARRKAIASGKDARRSSKGATIDTQASSDAASGDAKGTSSNG